MDPSEAQYEPPIPAPELPDTGLPLFELVIVGLVLLIAGWLLWTRYWRGEP